MSNFYQKSNFKLKIRKKHFFVIAAIAVIITIIILDFLDSDFNYHDILVEFHGLLFDLIVFGILLTIYENFETKQETIEYYQSLIKRLSSSSDPKAVEESYNLFDKLYSLKRRKIKIEQGHFYNHYDFSQFRNLQKCSFIMSNLQNANFDNNDLRKSKFLLTRLDNAQFKEVNFSKSAINSCNMTNAKFISVDFSDCDLSGSICSNTTFIDCNFKNANIDRMTINEENWLDVLQKNGNYGIQWNDYIIEKNEMKINGTKLNMIHKKTTHNNGYHK